MNQTQLFLSGVERPNQIKKIYNLKESEFETILDSDWQELFQQWKTLPATDSLRNELGEQLLATFYTSIYKYVAHLLQWQGKTKSPYFDDAFQEACVKFMEMLESYELKRNSNPFLYAKHRIQQTVLTTVNMYMLDTHKKDVKQFAKVQTFIQHNPSLSVEEIAIQLDMSESSVQYYIDMLSKKNTSYDIFETPDLFCVDTSTNLHKSVIYEINHCNLIDELKQCLTETEVSILFQMIGFDCEKKSAKEISETLDCTTAELYNKFYAIRKKLQKNTKLLELLQN